MEVFIDNQVYQVLDEFYTNALLNHPTLDEITVMNKIYRLHRTLDLLGKYAPSLPIARLKAEWVIQGYREYIIEDFHFAFRIYTDEKSGEPYVYVHDACHSLLYHE